MLQRARLGLRSGASRTLPEPPVFLLSTLIIKLGA
jgi:hypothetical protein